MDTADGAVLAAASEARRERLCRSDAADAAQNNLLLALEDLRSAGLTFNLTFSRAHFFLREGEEQVAAWIRGLGLRRDAARDAVARRMGWPKEGMDQLFAQAGVEPSWRAQFSDTMDSHRLARYAATVGRGEAMWDALSRRYFEGRTALRAIRLDDPELLAEAAAEAGLDAAEAARVVGDPAAFRDEVRATVDRMHEQGIHSIPVLVFSFGEGGTARQEVHHGSGNKAAFAAILREVHRHASAAAP